MEESLADITALDGVKLSEDPLESFKKYQDEYIFGKLLSPTYGENTCQVELEVLTGYPVYNMPGNAYTDYIDGRVDSLVSLYKNSGYVTYVYHPNTVFFNRSYVYNSMGFDNIKFKDDFELELKRISNWSDDETLFDNIIYDYENRDVEKPFLAFVVTTQNHGGYD